MKYHFIYPDIGTGYYPSVHHGLAQLFAILKTYGQEISLHHVKKENAREIITMIDREYPDIIGFTTMSNQVGYVERWSQWIKELYDIPIVCGGVHATLNPEEILNDTCVDMVCVGEGDRAIVDHNFWVKRNGHIEKHISYPLVENLDELPFPDYSLFDVGGMLKTRDGRFAVIVSRGCIYNCNYCCNSALREKLNGLGKYFRFRSVDNTLAMLNHYAGKYPVRSFSFADDIFGLNKKWVLEFCEKYPKSVGLPFDCNLRVESATKELLEALKSANCAMVEMGIESGSNWMRSEVLNRKMSNQQIIDAFENARKVGLKTRSYNMIGLPYETPEMARETLELNKRVKPDEVAVFYFYPYKGTKLYDICEKEGFLTEKQSTGYVLESVLKLPTISIKELKKIYGEFYRYMIKRRGWVFWLAGSVLRLLAWGNEVGVIRWIYIKLFPLFQRVRK